MQLRRSIQEIASGAKSLDPDVALNARKVGLARGKLTEAVAATLPDDIGTAWQNARTAFATEIAGPKRTLRTVRSEEHTSELQSRLHLVCRLLLEKKKQNRHM